MRDPGNIRDVGDLWPDYTGFIFHPGSRRYVGKGREALSKYLPDGVTGVGVFVNEKPESILKLAGAWRLTHVQLHGDEEPETCRILLKKGLCVIKAFRIATERDLERVNEYTDACDYYLFDARGEGWGGSGVRFDWSLLEDFRNGKPWFLSGGIGAGDAATIRELDLDGLYGVDVNSRFETAPGTKDITKLEKFMEEIRAT